MGISIAGTEPWFLLRFECPCNYEHRLAKKKGRGKTARRDLCGLPGNWQSYRDQLFLRLPAELLSFVQQLREAFE